MSLTASLQKYGALREERHHNGTIPLRPVVPTDVRSSYVSASLRSFGGRGVVHAALRGGRITSSRDERWYVFIDIYCSSRIVSMYYMYYKGIKWSYSNIRAC